MKKLLFVLAVLLAQVAQAQTCNPSFTWAAAPYGSAPLNVDFNNTTVANFPPVTTYVSYTINYGDNSNLAYFYNNSHVYTSPGTYTVTVYMEAYDSLTQNLICNASTSQQITVSYPSCYTSITPTNLGNGAFSFTANTLAGSSGMSYSWNFGDGTTATGQTVNHTYTVGGTYVVALVSSGNGCTYTTNYYLTAYTPVNCSNLAASFNHYENGLDITVYNTSPSGTTMPVLTSNATWDFGDGSTGSYNYMNHTYASAGTYTVTMYNNWVDSLTNQVVCSASTSQTVTVSNPTYNITGYVVYDSLTYWNASVKVWLIEVDSAANTLTAIDSTMCIGAGWYQFQLGTPGTYLVKAHMLNQTTGSAGYLPTYYSSSLYWNAATPVYNYWGSTSNVNIVLQQGTATSGPGFIGGNISQGANKGTAVGVPNLLVMLRNNANQLVVFTYTDANGDYSFNNLPAGSYNVYPESMSYLTTPSSAINLAAGSYTVNGINFKQTATEIKPVTTGIGETPESGVFSIAPNPSHGVIRINQGSLTNQTVTISLTDLNGRTVMSEVRNLAKNPALDLSGLQKGMYFIRLNSGKEQHTEKLIIQ